jgi:hypothetical protein
VDFEERLVDYYILESGGAVDGPRQVTLPGGRQPSYGADLGLAADEEGRVYLGLGLSDGNVIYGILDLASGSLDSMVGVQDIRAGLDLEDDLSVADLTYSADHIWMILPQVGAAIRFGAENGVPRGSLGIAENSDVLGDWVPDSVSSFDDQWADRRMAIGRGGRMLVVEGFNANLESLSPR